MNGTQEDDFAWFRTQSTSILMCLYGLILVVGVPGNISVLCVVTRVLRAPPLSAGRKVTPQNDHLFVYILALSIVDLLVLTVIPFLLIEFYYQYWLFGVAVCKYFWIMENVNKLLSVAILVCMSIDRYMAVCKPMRLRWLHTKQTVLKVLAFCVLLCCFLMFPAIYYADVQTETYELGNNLTVVLRKCALDQLMPESFLPYFIAYMIIFAYCLPALIITLCYVQLLRFVRKNIYSQKDNASSSRTKERHSQKALRVASKSVLRVVGFYFICWTPYWLTIMLPLMSSWTPGDNLILILLLVHCFPYINSAGNWLFYACMNRDLRRRSGGSGRVNLSQARESVSALVETLPLRQSRTKMTSVESNHLTVPVDL